MRLTEPYQRVKFSTPEVTLTIDDLKAYTRPWVTNAVVSLSPHTELRESFLRSLG